MHVLPLDKGVAADTLLQFEVNCGSENSPFPGGARQGEGLQDGSGRLQAAPKGPWAMQMKLPDGSKPGKHCKGKEPLAAETGV